MAGRVSSGLAALANGSSRMRVASPPRREERRLRWRDPWLQTLWLVRGEANGRAGFEDNEAAAC